jgi:hypothetical protein
MNMRWGWLVLVSVSAAALVLSCGDDDTCPVQPCPPYSVSGYVRDEAGHGMSGVRITQGCDTAGGVDTDTSGHWIVGDISADSCTFTPEKDGCMFFPSCWTVSGNAQNVNFTANCGPPYTVSGYVRDAEGNGISGVRVMKQCDQGGWTETGANGYWVIAGISSEVCQFTPQKENWEFTPENRTVARSARGVNFTGNSEGYTVDEELPRSHSLNLLR